MNEAQERIELSEGVALLLQRMESHPEEFKDSAHGKWNHVLAVVEERIFNPADRRRAEPWMTDDEVRAIWGGYQRAKQKSFHDFVMKKLLDDTPTEEEPQLRANPYPFNPAQPIQPGQFVNVTTQTSTGPITLQGNTTVQGTFDAEPSPSFVQKIKRELGL
jgi:hypothetical protein